RVLEIASKNRRGMRRLQLDVDRIGNGQRCCHRHQSFSPRGGQTIGFSSAVELHAVPQHRHCARKEWGRDAGGGEVLRDAPDSFLKSEISRPARESLRLVVANNLRSLCARYYVSCSSSRACTGKRRQMIQSVQHRAQSSGNGGRMTFSRKQSGRTGLSCSIWKRCGATGAASWTKPPTMTRR